MRKLILSFVAMAAGAVIVSCGGAATNNDEVNPSLNPGDLSGVTVQESKSTGEFTPSLSAGLGDDGNLKFTVGGLDVDGDNKIESPTVADIKVSTGSLIKSVGKKDLVDVDVLCDDGRVVGAGTTDKYDIGFSLDTTSSMGSAVEAIAAKIRDFATSLNESGIDVRFAGVTVGDAFATKSTSGSSFTDTISKGPLGDNPSFDYCERPSTGSAVLAATDIETFFNEVMNVDGGGCGGAGSVENYLGSLEYLYESTAWRDGAAKIMISIGDNCAYSPDSYTEDGITGVWIPSKGSDAEAAIAGNATVHVIGPDSCYGTTYYDMKGLADATGGTFTTFGCYSSDTCNVDLDALPIKSAITSSRVYECDGASDTFEGGGTYTFTIDLTVVGSLGGTHTAQVVIVVDLLFM